MNDASVPRVAPASVPPLLPPWTLALAPLPAIAAGAWIARRAEAPKLAFVPNVVALCAGAVLVLLAPHLRPSIRDRLVPSAAIVGTALLVRTLASPGIQDVHRWLPLGPFRLHVSMACTPWLALAFARASHRGDVVQVRLAASLVTIAQIVHLAQPDAQQAWTLVLGLAPLLLTDRVSPRLARSTWACAVLFAVLTARRPDPLAPLPHVERILGLALTQGALVFVCAAACVLLLVAPLALVASEAGPRGKLALAATLWVVTQIAATALGAFPVPVLGAGAAGVLGVATWLAALQASRKGRRAEPAAQVVGG